LTYWSSTTRVLPMGAGQNDQRVLKLLAMLRQRTPKEITVATLALAGGFSPEMWCALELLALERGMIGERKAS